MLQHMLYVFILHADKLIIHSLFNKMVKLCTFLPTADFKVTHRSFNFAKKHGLPFYFVSAADGTNVVKVGHYCFFIGNIVERV